MKFIIDGEYGYWRVFVEKTPESGAFEEVNISECSRVEINADIDKPGASVSFVRKEHISVNAQSSNEFIDGEPPFVSGHDPGQTCYGCEMCWIKNPKFKGYISQPNDQG